MDRVTDKEPDGPPSVHVSCVPFAVLLCTRHINRFLFWINDFCSKRTNSSSFSSLILTISFAMSDVIACSVVVRSTTVAMRRSPNVGDAVVGRQEEMDIRAGGKEK